MAYKRGNAWYVKWRDADGRQVQERVGSTAEMSQRKAEAVARQRRVDVERDRLVKPARVTFGSFVDGWVDAHCDAEGLKRSTRRGYRQIVANHLEPVFGKLELPAIDVDRLERFKASKRKQVGPATMNRILNVLSLVLGDALRRGLVRQNAVALVKRPREPRRSWRILTPAETLQVERAFGAMEQTDDVRTARLLFLTFMATGMRRGEALGLRWRCVHLADPDGPWLRVEETWTRGAIDTPKSQAGFRSIALGRRLADELFEHRARSVFAGDDERVFANPRTGHVFSTAYDELVKAAYAAAGVVGMVRPAHDLRHSSITNAAAAGTSQAALQARAGHSSYATTQRYIDLAGETFREEADRLEQRLWGNSGTKSRDQTADAAPVDEAEGAARTLG